MTQKDQFIYYLEHSSGLETTTQKQYIGVLSKISVTIARIKKVDTFDIYQVQDVQELDEIIGALKQDDEFKGYDRKWRNKPSAALNYYREFISGSNPVLKVMTQKDQFIDFLKHSTKLADRTQKHYIWALSNIDNTIARIKKVDTFDIYQVQDIQELDEIIGALKQDDELKNNRERGKYIAALKKYRELISGSNPVMSNNKEQNKGVDSRQIIFFGTPGSGKSYRVNVLTEEKRVHRTTFHPDSDYASFVGCYKPTMKDGEITYSFSPQVFTEAYVDVWKNPKEEVYLVIEEINRGNCAQIFGDLFQLLDRNSDGYSDYPITADSDLRDYLYGVLGEGHEGIKDGKLCLPPNLRIFATMNTSDQSLFPMDSAFKRRWDWEYVPVDYRKPESNFTITLGEEKYRWLEFLQTINQRIFKATNSEDKQMGNFFIKEHVSESEFKSKVMFYLWNEVCRDEYGTQNNFFRFMQNDKDIIEFSFNDLYQEDGWKKLQGFMEYLGVLPLSLTEGTEEEQEEPEQA